MFDTIKMKIILSRAHWDEQRFLKKNKDREKENKEVPLFTPSDPDSFEVFKKVCPGTGLFVFEPIAWIALCIIFFSLLYTSLPLLPIVFGIVVFLQILQIILNQLRYRIFFKGWYKRLPYTLYGWEEMIHSKRMYADLCWTDINITVETDEKSHEYLQYIKASLLLFCKRAGKAFYSRKTGSNDYRKTWSITTDTSAQGSANTEVMRYMKKLFDHDLAIMAKNKHCISSARIHLVSQEYEVPIEIRSSEGSS